MKSVRKKGRQVPTKTRQADAEQTRRSSEWVVPALRVLAYALWLAATLAGKGCGPN
ncbi:MULTISPECIES: hypothetical protein [Micromonospora]|uniref:hypothetical protein n=1 Tax=Micromonospora TaxID=1873 RepID=UPI0001C43840|nr:MULTISPECIES: hypothetical protein [Micromonospora]ADU06203.1 hypothetical protein ML5_0653 [Micromonospora sp. L5]